MLIPAHSCFHYSRVLQPLREQYPLQYSADPCPFSDGLEHLEDQDHFFSYGLCMFIVGALMPKKIE